MTTKQNNTQYQRSYSLADIARKINRPRTTVQAWRDQFKVYLPTVSGSKGRHTRYPIEALTLFELISYMKDNNEPPEMIERTLKQNVDYIIVEEEKANDQPPIIWEMFENSRRVSIQSELILKMLEEQKQINNELKKQLQEQQNLQQQTFKKIEAHQKYIEEKIMIRDDKLITHMREVLETKQQIAITNDQKPRKYLKGLFNDLLGLLKK